MAYMLVSGEEERLVIKAHIRDRLKTRLQIVRAVRVYAADAIECSDLDKESQDAYWEGIKDALTLTLSLFDELELSRENELLGQCRESYCEREKSS